MLWFEIEVRPDIPPTYPTDYSIRSVLSPYDDRCMAWHGSQVLSMNRTVQHSTVSISCSVITATDSYSHL